jgi:TetR/AcrR family transcriptional regulator
MKARGEKTRVRGHARPNSRVAILSAAERIFAEVGLEGARTDALAAAAGVNKALLYYYFKSKDDLYEAVLENHLQDFNRRAMEVLSREGSACSKLLDFVSMHFDVVSSRASFGRLWPRLMLSSGSVLERLMKKYSFPIKQRLIRLISQGIEQGELRDVDPGHAVISLVALTNFYFLMAPLFSKVAEVDLYSHVQLARRKKEILEVVRYGFFRHPEAHSS